MSDLGVSAKALNVVTLIVILCIGASYIIYLGMSWQALQADRQFRNAKIDELLDKLTPKTEVVTDVKPSSE